MAANSSSSAQHWQQVMKGSDKEAFQRIVEPYMDVLLNAARRDLRYYLRNGILHEGDFSPEELVGEGLIHAWKHRKVRPDEMPLRSWLLGTQHRVTRGLVDTFRSYRREKGLSLDEPVPINEDAFDAQDWFWDWYQPEEKLTWEDVIPAREPQDIEIDLDESRETLLEDAEERHALVLHHEFEMSLPEVAFTINRSPNAVAELLERARAGLRARQAERDAGAQDHPPAPGAEG